MGTAHVDHIYLSLYFHGTHPPPAHNGLAHLAHQLLIPMAPTWVMFAGYLPLIKSEIEHWRIYRISKEWAKTGQIDENGGVGPAKYCFRTISTLKGGSQNGFWPGHWLTLARFAAPPPPWIRQ